MLLTALCNITHDAGDISLDVRVILQLINVTLDDCLHR